MKTADQWFDDYGVSHKNPTNKAIHWVCVPIIFFSSIGLFWSIPHDYFADILPGALAPYLNWGTILVVLGSIFYLTLSFSIFLGMLLLSLLSLWGNYHLSMWEMSPLWLTSMVLFVVAWAGQFIGHEIEGRKPSFFKDIQFLLVGPAWLLHFVYKKLGISY
ncbi:MAG TPA: DUF962 domain-containing protein [Myxococcales bacterium]|nr:DUF962 domain-containing protein [Myxococcales bacterium]